MENSPNDRLMYLPAVCQFVKVEFLSCFDIPLIVDDILPSACAAAAGFPSVSGTLWYYYSDLLK